MRPISHDIKSKHSYPKVETKIWSAEMAYHLLLSLGALCITLCHAQSQTTWVVTNFITAKFETSTTVKYGNSAVTPVKRSSSLKVLTSYTSEPPVSRDSTVTSWVTAQTTLPVSTLTLSHTTTVPHPSVVTNNGTWTSVSMVSPIAATVTLSPAVCANDPSPSNGTFPAKTATVYTGTYAPFPGQVTTAPPTWPTAAITLTSMTVSYRVLTKVGTQVTVISTVTASNWLSTTTLSTNSTVSIFPFKFLSTSYLHTVTVTSSDWQLAYTTKPAAACSAETAAPAAAAPPTVTRALQCAPSNLIAERDGHGTAINRLPRDWAVPIDYNNTLIGIPGMDASACCQLCLDNAGCAASEWTIEWHGACRLYYYGYGNDTCGGAGDAGTLEYFGDSGAFPRQESFLQAGCGRLRYRGVWNPSCPTCKGS